MQFLKDKFNVKVKKTTAHTQTQEEERISSKKNQRFSNDKVFKNQ